MYGHSRQDASMTSSPNIQTTVLPSTGSCQRVLVAKRLTVAPWAEGVGISDTGVERENNQDAFRMVTTVDASAERRILFAVADGMGGLLHGRMASTMALDVFFESFSRNSNMRIQKAMRRAIEEANLILQQAASRLRIARMGTTLTAVCLDGAHYHFVHAGDSRVYLIRNGAAKCLTHDHSTAGEMVRLGILSPDKIRTHEHRSELTQGLGLSLFLQPESFSADAQPGDRLVLCTDGVWGVIEDEQIAALSSEEPSPQEFGRRLVDLAMEHGSDDNVSVVVVEQTEVLPVADVPAPEGMAGLIRRLFHRSSGSGDSPNAMAKRNTTVIGPSPASRGGLR
jgi:PPM family protein phosphatase